MSVRFAIALLSMAAFILAGCGGDSARGFEHQLDPAAERLVTAALALTAPAVPAGSPTPVANDRSPGSNATIRAGGTGVSLRSDCLDAARSGGAWADGAVVTVAEIGADRCTGWSRVTLAAVTSWVRTEYLVASADASSSTAPAAASGGVGRDLRPQVASLRETAWRVALLLRSTPGTGNGVMAPVYLEMAALKARELGTEVRSTPADALPNCAPARTRLVSAAGELERLANVAKAFFESPGPDGIGSTTRAVDTYINEQAALTSVLGACFAS
jgi:hypothetical protein